ncbi:MAG: JmjC domain-containing protein [Croceibacterium sp.]
MQLTSFDSGRFLRDHWQKKPLLIRNPWDGWRNPLEPDELAGLACEDSVESRLIMQDAGRWNLEQGPLDESRFGQLGGRPWTLLVQSVDHHVPAVAALLEAFRFIPDWRIDDVMVSYADDGGGVGAHYDQYDVFLLQGLGRRRWQLGGSCDEQTELLPHDDLRLLADFEPLDEWILEPGDMLYVPPGVAHNGIAVGDQCMTYSIGFRAPSRSELIAGWSEHLLAELGDDERYTDSDLAVQRNPGEIGSGALDRLHAMTAAALGDRDAFARWFGQFTTAPKNPDIDWRPEQPLEAAEAARLLLAGIPLLRNPASRISFARTEPLSLFVDGECYQCTGETAAFAELLCDQRRFILSPAMAGSSEVVALAVELLNHGRMAFEPGD